MYQAIFSRRAEKAFLGLPNNQAQRLKEVIEKLVKGIRLLASLLLVVLAAGGCVSQKGEGFSIYLLARDMPVSRMPVISHVELADEPLISINDIISYKKEIHGIKLTADAYQRVSTLHIPVDGKVFVVCVDHNPVYWGAFWTSISSIPFSGVAIVKPIASDDRLIQIQLGYPSPEFFTGADPRSDPQILRALEGAGKLK